MVSGLAEDSPPQPVERPRRKQIKQEVIAAIQAEAELMHSFIARTRILFGSLDANRHDFTRMAIGLLLGMADDLESDLIMRSGTRPLRYLTGLDRSAKLCLLSIGSLIEALNSGAPELPQADAQPLLLALSDGKTILERIRQRIEPYVTM